MSTEARAPGEDVEGLAKRLETHDCDERSGGCELLRDEAAATLRDLSRKLEEAREPEVCGVCVGRPLASGKPCICGGTGTAVAEMAGLRAALEEARRERDALGCLWCNELAAPASNLCPQHREQFVTGSAISPQTEEPDRQRTTTDSNAQHLSTCTAYHRTGRCPHREEA